MYCYVLVWFIIYLFFIYLLINLFLPFKDPEAEIDLMFVKVIDKISFLQIQAECTVLVLVEKWSQSNYRSFLCFSLGESCAEKKVRKSKKLDSEVLFLNVKHLTFYKNGINQTI